MTAAKHVVWDFDGTLARRPWSSAVLAAIHAHGLSCDARPEDVRPFLQTGFPWHEPHVVREPRRSSDEWWAELEPIFVEAIRSLTDADPVVAKRVAAGVREVYADPAAWSLHEDVHSTLQAFAASGWTQLLLTNHVPELPAIVHGLGLSPYFARIFNSAETGVEKPHPRAFQLVLDSIPAGAPVWMIGDSFDADVLGAESAGIRAVLVRNAHPKAPRFCPSLRDAFDLLTSG